VGGDGAPFTEGDAITTTADASGLDFNGSSTAILISSFASSCANQQGNVGVVNGKTFFLGLANVDASGGSSPVTAPGTFTITTSGTGSGLLAQVFFEVDGADCLKMTNLQAVSGTVQITHVDAGGMAGTLDATFDGNVKVSGTFDAASCPSLNPNRTPNATCH
jgi:hypothetical protein